MAWQDNFISATDFDSIRLSVASSEDILNWSYGEVLKPETINYRTQKPERDGLFCERIFGPVKDINPNDSKLKGVRSREAAVDKEGNLVTKSITRRERMGHISLAAPVAHIWFMRGTPSALSLLLNLTVKNIEKVVYFAAYLITDVKAEEAEKKLADLEAETDAARQAIKIRYEAEAKSETADVKALAEAQSKEIEEVDTNYADRKAKLDSFVKGSIISEADYRNLEDEYEELITVGMGASAVKKMLENIDLSVLIAELEEEAESAKGQKEKKIIKRLKVLEGMLSAGIKPTDLTLNVIPVIPPDLRPMISLAGGRFATSDLNDLYRRVINRNNRLKKLIDLNAPEVICRNEMRMLQEAVDALIDNNASHGGRTANSQNGRRKLKSLSDLLKGKQGRFRQNLLGKRVDYSGRSVIVVGPELRIHECGLPKQMALELFKPFVISWLITGEHAANIRAATRLIEQGEIIIWDALDEVIKGKYVLLNRAPSLHRLSVQAFQPKLIDGKAIQLHPLVANGFNADYDGDQMAVHLPLSAEAQAEARELMTAGKNLLKPADGAPVLSISQDVVLGNYYLTYEKPSAQTERKAYTSVYEAELAYDMGIIQLQTPIRVHTKGKKRDTTLGRVFFNEVLPKDYPYDNDVQNSKHLKKVMADVMNQFGADVTVETADAIKDLAFEYETIAAVSTSKDDYPTYPEVDVLLAEGEGKAAMISEQFDEGLITDDERYRLTVAAWREVDNKIGDLVKNNLALLDTNVSIMVNSGARGSASNIKLASAAIGIMVDVFNREIELPVKSSYKKGLNTLESFIATRGARQGQVSTALRTADSGYLTRRLVDVSQDVFTVEDGAADPGFRVFKHESEYTGIDFASRIIGRYSAEKIEKYGLDVDELITKDVADQIAADDTIDGATIQSILTTECANGVPLKAYGIDMSTRRTVALHEPVGVIAAQSVGEPGTQLTLDTKHSSGVAGSGAISRGLPRVEELLEARAPKGQAYMATISGIVNIWEEGRYNVVQITPEAGEVERIALDGRKSKVKDGASVKAGDVIASKAKGAEPIVAPFDGIVELTENEIVMVAGAGAPVKIEIPSDYALTVKSGESVLIGDRISEGSLNLQDLMKYKGIPATERYIVNDILAIYAAQGHEISAKHLEIIVRQMFSRVMIEEPGDSPFVAGDIMSRAVVLDANRRLEAEGKEQATFVQMLLGISKVAIYSDSFLSAASFQDTTRVLINSAIQGRVDHLKGLKENVIIGRKIPVGTGVEPLAVYAEGAAESDIPTEDEIAEIE
ncbi:MAG: DNA-directed RNA polymerase subunit beta' [Candidatus Nomurabacteria bacterium]|jgi:DNA-directed RNA polymerase subunit beta'|nr:DNA-directed RNA polymerase subunit beta' [Candidatus Nomurabacteria bacterium]